MAKKVLLIEDDRDLIQLLRFNLEREGYRVRYAMDGGLALAKLRRYEPDVLILDLMLPGTDGLEICRQVRQSDQFSGLPILMLTACAEGADRVVGLEIGADDYVTKPFSIRELVARVRALLRRRDRKETEPQFVHRGRLVIDVKAHKVTIGDRPIDLSALEFRLLHFLASHPGSAFSRDQLLDRVWGSERNVIRRSVDVYIRRLREKMQEQAGGPEWIETVRCVGYRFAESDT